ncbi:MAG: molybdopterin-dependent oxidoreductase, partial [Novosphingobium sp.]|nr:molybdopterin-dependent oxidoreductase [Novosphingobium sp.]
GQAPGRIRGVAQLAGERLTATLAEEILTPGEGQVRCLLIAGANPMSSMPDTLRLREALQALDCLVVIDPYMSATAQYADYIIPPRMQYERADVPISLNGFTLFTENWAQYAAPVIEPPAGSEVCDEWYPFWAIARRLGFAINYLGKGLLPMDEPPTTEQLLEMKLEGGRVSYDEIRQYPGGHIWNFDEDSKVLPGRPGESGRFDVMPDDVAQEVRDFLAVPVTAQDIRSNGRSFSHLLSARRMRDVFCSNGTVLEKTLRSTPYNPAFLHPDDMHALGAESGDALRITSDRGSIVAVAEADATVRPGVVSLAGGWGGDPVEPGEDWNGAANVNLLIACDRDVETINAMPRLSAIPVNLERVNAAVAGR